MSLKPTKTSELNPAEDHCEIVRRMLHDGFVWDVVRSLELALFRTFAVPSIGKLLDKTGEFENNGQKRYDDTSLILLKVLEHGYDSDFGRRAIERMNRTHAHYRISNEDYLFTLSTFVIDPIRWIDQFGWRRMTADEQESLFLLMRNVGQRMGLADVPVSLQEMIERSDAFVAENFQHTEPNQRVAEGTIRIVQAWLPGILQPLVAPVSACLLDERTRVAVGLKKPNVLLSVFVRGVLRTRALFKRLGPLTLKQRWPNGERSYPGGYQIEELAPQKILDLEAKAAAKQG